MPARRAEPDPGTGLGCPRREDVTAWVQGQLPPRDEASFREHLAECAGCRAEAGDVKELIDAIRSPDEPSREVELLPRLLARLDGERAAAAGRSRRIAAAAAIAVAAASAVVVGRALLDRAPAPDDRELAIERAVEWLEGAQEPSGGFHAARWGGLADYDVGLTGLAALALLSRPGVPSPRAAMAIDFILAAQSADGRFGPEFPGAVYNHGIATVALIEAFRAGGEEELRRPIDRALSHIERTRRPGGGWGYLDGGESAANTAATFWPLEALLLARSLGWKGLDPAIEGGFRHLARVTDDRGRVGYRRAGELEAGPEALSSMGALCLFLGSEARAVPSTLRGRILDGVARAAATGPRGHDLYRDFFLHSALESFPVQQRGPWPDRARRALLAAQVEEGPYRGSWDPSDTWGPAGGRVYSTAMGALILEARGRGPRFEAQAGGGGQHAAGVPRRPRRG